MPLNQTEETLQRAIQEHSTLGVQLYVSRRGGVLADAAFGEARPGVPMSTESLMLWLSSGKPLTATAIAQCCDRGALDWDDPVAFHIPEFSANGKQSITVRHVLTHTSGFRSADLLDEQLDWDETIQRICSSPLERDWRPGEKAGYQLSSSWFILGEIVRRLDGRPLDRYVREEILVPLAMAQSRLSLTLDEFRAREPEFSATYLTEKLPPRPHPYWNDPTHAGRCRPGSSARGPIRELGRFYEAWLGLPENGPSIHSILSTRTADEMVQRQRVGLYDHTFRHVVDFGLGFLLNSNRYGRDTVPYGYGPSCSEETFGHSGAQSSCAFADPAHQLIVAWACNGLPGEARHQARARDINAAIYRDLGLA